MGYTSLAHLLEERGADNGYSKVYSAMYRFFEINTYKAMTQTQFPAVMQWLKEWHKQVESGGSIEPKKP